MDGTVFIIGAILFMIAIVFFVNAANKDKKNNTNDKTDAKVDPKITITEPNTVKNDDPKSSSGVVFSDNFKTGETITKNEKGHTITTLLRYKEDGLVWICPACETENPSYNIKCYMCHHAR